MSHTGHRVQLGDTLASIAERDYGKARCRRVIYHESFGQIGDNVRRLQPGIALRIP